MKAKSVMVLAVLSMFLTACLGSAQAKSSGDPVAGEALFHSDSIREAPACGSCHSTEPDKKIVGPSLAGIAARAGERVDGLSAEEYIRQSILDPNAYVVDGFTQGIMYQKFEEVLADDEINNLVAYLMALK